jgi:hypothetical protein
MLHCVGLGKEAKEQRHKELKSFAPYVALRESTPGGASD